MLFHFLLDPDPELLFRIQAKNPDPCGFGSTTLVYTKGGEGGNKSRYTVLLIHDSRTMHSWRPCLLLFKALFIVFISLTQLLIYISFPLDICTHRISTTRMEMAGSRLVFSKIEPNWPLPYSTVPVPHLRDARLAGWVTYCSISASTLPRAQNRTGKGSILLWRRNTLPI